MDPKAILEAIVAVGLTPVVSIGMALLVVGGIIYLVRKLNRE